MPTSQARIDSNRMNSRRSTGPKTSEGKRRSRQNSLKHGLTGAGILLGEQDASEVETRNNELQAELDPQSSLGKILVRQMAKLSVRMERGAKHEGAAIGQRVRHAVDDFDRARLDEADRLLDILGEDPRIPLRTLMSSPEGVDRLIVAWQDLKADLTRNPRPAWTAWHLERAVNLTGLRIDAASGSWINALSKAAWGDFADMGIPGDDDVDQEVRKAEARTLLVDVIDVEIAGLEAHYETLDFETLDLDRAQAPDLALFDPSHEATLARRYESEATRGFFKALKELRQAEAEAAARPELAATPDIETDSAPLTSFGERPSPAPLASFGERPSPAPLASFGERPSPAPREPRPMPEPSLLEDNEFTRDTIRRMKSDDQVAAGAG